jgi:hypothetical protein
MGLQRLVSGIVNKIKVPRNRSESLEGDRDIALLSH